MCCASFIESQSFVYNHIISFYSFIKVSSNSYINILAEFRSYITLTLHLFSIQIAVVEHSMLECLAGSDTS